jgi:hypothetical protein
VYSDLDHGVDSTESVLRHASEEMDKGVHDASEDHLPSEPLPAASQSAAAVIGISQVAEADELCSSEALTVSCSSPDFVDAVDTVQYLPPEPHEEPDMEEEEAAQFVQAEDGSHMTNTELTEPNTDVLENKTLEDQQEDVTEVKFKIGEFEESVMEDKEEPLPSSEATGNRAYSKLLAVIC